MRLDSVRVRHQTGMLIPIPFVHLATNSKLTSLGVL